MQALSGGGKSLSGCGLILGLMLLNLGILPGGAEPEANTIYDPNPQHLWNRFFGE
jgi:hypothetical protein